MSCPPHRLCNFSQFLLGAPLIFGAWASELITRPSNQAVCPFSVRERERERERKRRREERGQEIRKENGSRPGTVRNAHWPGEKTSRSPRIRCTAVLRPAVRSSSAHDPPFLERYMLYLFPFPLMRLEPVHAMCRHPKSSISRIFK